VAAYLPYFDGSGQTLTDLSGHGNNVQLGSTAGADADDPTWGTGGKWLEFDGIDDILSSGPSATTVWSLLGDSYGNALGWVRGKRKNVAGRMYAELRFNREIGAFERARIFKNVETLLTAQGITGTFYDWAYPIPCTAGVMDFSISNADDLLLVAPDGTTSTDARPQFNLASAGTTWCYCSNWDETVGVIANDTKERYLGDLADIPPALDYSLHLSECTNLSGDTSYISNIKRYVNLYKCYDITGQLSDFGDVYNYLAIQSCSHITGQLKDISAVEYFVNVYGCSDITGPLTPHEDLESIRIGGTNLSTADLDQSIINLAAVTTVTGGTLYYDTGIRSAASDDAYDALDAAGWSLTAREW
jgi:hypothetical protein